MWVGEEESEGGEGRKLKEVWVGEEESEGGRE